MAGFWETVPLGSLSSDLSKTNWSKDQLWWAELWVQWLLGSLRRDPRCWNHHSQYREPWEHNKAMEHTVLEGCLHIHINDWSLHAWSSSHINKCGGEGFILFVVMGFDLILNLTSLNISRPFQISSTFLALSFLYYLLHVFLFERSCHTLLKLPSLIVFVIESYHTCMVSSPIKTHMRLLQALNSHDRLLLV